MSKHKKKEDKFRKRMEKLMLRQYLKEASGIWEKSSDSSPVFLLGKGCQNVQPDSLEDTVAEQRLANCVMDKVMESITPYITAQWQKDQYDKKKLKSMRKRIRRLETQIAEQGIEQKQLCRALTYFLAAAANISMSNVSASDLEKGFKEFYKQYRKSKKHSAKKMKEISLLPMDAC